ncbi:hypothetical protein GYN24_10070 [Lactococcus piscium]|uniref:Uncharacterized protein n=1 Tax=Pseudolactococcus paracarnosus TaxID=2749962 RepID=A0A7L4WFU9_9LACT|nr:hypothetical protein [Lactococcus paracarnosus]MCJ1994926.1 hypothetical protein [Lactococcus paracarnosus]QDJ28185.1 hypothetical protein BHS01_06450 [Lactococcus paracarnosus]SPC35422.1 exported hypothetical protein [Lactococcus piscium]
MKRKLTQVLMVFVLLGQIIAPSIHCIVQASEQLPVYVVKASQKKEINKAKLSTVLKNSTISDATYTVSEPVALFTMVADKLVEDAYFPIIVQKKIAALIRYNSETDKFVLEKETVVKEITSKYLETTSQSPLVLVCVSGEILGKNRTGYYNFSNPEMVEEEVKPLFSQVDLSAVNLEDAQNIYDVPKADVTDDASHEIPGPDIKASESTDKVSNTDKSASKDKVDKQNKVYKTDDGLKDTRLKAGPFVENPQQYQKIAPILPRIFDTGYGPAKKDYTKGLISETDYVARSNYGSLNKKDLYFLIKSKDGQYAYSKLFIMRWHWKIPVSQLKIDRFYFEQLGGDKGNASLVDDQKNLIQFYFKPEFYTYYASYSSKNQNPYQGKSLNDLLNWLNFWTDNEISIVQMSSYEIEHDVLRRNTGVEYKPAKVDYTKEISNKDYNLEDNYVSLNRSDLYFLIKSKDGQYAYSKLLTMRWHWKIPASQLKFDRFYFEQLGGDKGNASLVDDQKNWIQFHLKPEFYTYYASYSSTYKNPYQGKSLNDLLNWFHFWTDNEISIVQESTIALFTAQKNKEIKEWQFFKEGRTSSKDQFYRFSLNQTTRLNISAYGAPYQKLTVYNKQKQKYFEMNYYSFYGFSDILDLPAGDYYIQLTNVQNKTIFQMTKSLFLDQQLSVETSPEKTDVYLNHQFNPQLTALYKPYHQKSGNNTAINVLNQLTDVWYFSYQHYEVLDNLFGNDHKVRLPSLRQITVQNLGFQPLGNDLRKKSMQYIGRNTFYANNTMFQTRFTPQQRIIGVDDLAYLAIGVAAVALYSAYLVSQTPTSSAISLNIPMFQEPTFGSWPVEKRFDFDGTLDYKVKTYGVNEDTGEIRDIDSGVDLPEEIISRAFRAEIPKVRTQAIAQALIGAEVEIPRNYKWYTVKDLIEDETRDWQSAGGHTIAKHISKSDDYLKNRAKTGTMAIASSYDTVLQALIAINLAKITNIFRFTTVSTKQYTINTITADTQENLVQALARQDYQFRQKEAGQRTEQMTAKLLKVIEVNKPDQFVFLGLKEHICPVTDPEKRFEG